MFKSILPEPRLRMLVGVLLWAISSALTAGLFLAFAREDPFHKVVLLGLALGLEGAKILSWRMGKGYRTLAVALISLSIFASFGAALETVEVYRLSLPNHDEHVTNPGLEKAQASIQQQINILMDRLAMLPSDFTTAALKLNAEISGLRESLADISMQLAITHENETLDVRQRTIFELLGVTLGLEPETIMMIILFFMALCLELSALVLTGHQDIVPAPNESPGDGLSKPFFINPKPGPVQTKITSEAFLAALMDGAELPILNGRDKTAQALGITYYEAKLHVKRLVKAGRIHSFRKRMTLRS